MSRDEGAPAGGAVFVATRDGDLMVHADAGWAVGWMEAIDVEDGEYVAAYRVDGAVMAISTAGEQVRLDLTGDGDVAGWQAAINTHERRVSVRTSAVTALDYAEDRFAREWGPARGAVAAVAGPTSARVWAVDPRAAAGVAGRSAAWRCRGLC